ncbi:MliC family protein [Alkanindiges sp. WGS2144]|uniref:MliC family protein n=1 Tax=Alkanindiges sp. WGS2144 TaxID=3366808 RepID=UPI003751A28F
MKWDKKQVPWLLIIGGIIIALVTYYRLGSLPANSSQVQTTASNQDQLAAAAPVKPAISYRHINYQCDHQQVIQATYIEEPEAAPKAQLTIDGKTYELYSVPASIGELYATEQGVNPQEGMRWHIQGLEARLTNMILDHTAEPGQGKLIMRCQQPV